MRPHARWLLACASGLAALPLGWWLLRREAAPVRLINRSEEVDRILTDRAATGGAALGERIPREVAETFFLTDKGRFEWDPLCYYRYRPGYTQRRRWPEHPDGEWTRTTNAQGLRESTDARLGDADLAVLVTGDSHTDGACNNHESFSNRLEARLREREPGQRIEVLNAGVVGYSFYNYLGVLERFLPEGPDVFIVCVYGGNDFFDLLKPHHWLNGTAYPPRRYGYWDRIEAAQAVSQTFVAQSLNQALFLQEHPEEIEAVFEGTMSVCGEMARLCRDNGVRLVIAYLPPAYEASWPELDALVERAMESLDLTEADLFVTRRLEERFFAGLRELGIEPIDLGPVLRAHGERCYWKRDLHLNVVGHEVVARTLEEHLAAGGGELGPLLPVTRPDGPAEERDGAGALLARGSWQDGRRDGEWTLFYPDGTERCRGAWSAGARSGAWTWWYENGQEQQRGEFEHDQRVGTWREWYRDGAPRREGRYDAGRPTGTWREWHPGQVLGSEGPWVDGREHGLHLTYYPGAEPQSRLTYERGVLHGPAERWREDGSLTWGGEFERGQRAGPWTFEHPGGQPQASGPYVDGLRDGPWSFWNIDGTLDETRTGVYLAGKRKGDLP